MTRDAPRRRAPGSPLRIGLTGPIGCGKSTVAQWLQTEGALIVDADHVARETLAAGTPAFSAVVTEFGRGLVRDDGELDRGALGRIVFRDPLALARLEAITHPEVRRQILLAFDAADLEHATAPGIVVEAIKLIEGGLAELCDEVWLVVCSPSQQRARLQGRGLADEDAESRITTQGDLESRLRRAATRVIDTSGTAEPARARVLAAWRAALEHHRAGPKAGSVDADEVSEEP